MTDTLGMVPSSKPPRLVLQQKVKKYKWTTGSERRKRKK